MPNESLIIDVDYNITKAEAKQRKLNREFELSKQKANNISNEIEKTKRNIEESKIKQQQYNAELDRSSQKLDAYLHGQIELSDKQLQTELKKNAEIQKRIAQEEKNQVLQEASLSKQNIALDTQNAKTAALGEKIVLNSKKQSAFAGAFQKSAKSASVFAKRMGSVVRSALIFTVITKALAKLRETFGKMITEQGTKTAELAAQLKGNFAVIGTTLYESAKPAIEWLLQALVKITQVLTYGIAKILGKSVEEMRALTKQTKKAGEEAKKATAGFDTLQTIDTSSNSSNDDSGIGTDFSALNSGLDSELALLMTILSGAVLVLGVILAFTGVNIPLGIGLIALGAIGLVGTVALSWGTLDAEIQNTILIITAIVSSALLVLGAIFAFTGVNIPLGIAFMLLGAAGLVTAVSTSWNSLSDKTKEIIGIITFIVSSAILVLGVIFAFTGVAIGLGIAFMVLGAAGLASAASLSWNSMSDKTKNVITEIMAIGGLLLLIIGILLCITGVGIPLGIALIALGAASLVGSIALNWDAITDKVKSIASTIGKLFKNCWDGIKKGFKAMVNGIISFANLWIDGLNLLLLPVRGLITGIAKAFGSDIKLKDVKIPHIPKLATGAILPGGSPMLAWVNDQPKGQPYVEGSIENIAAAFEKYLGGRGLESQNITIEAKGNWAQFIKWMNLEIKKENKRATLWG